MMKQLSSITKLTVGPVRPLLPEGPTSPLAPCKKIKKTIKTDTLSKTELFVKSIPGLPAEAFVQEQLVKVFVIKIQAHCFFSNIYDLPDLLKIEWAFIAKVKADKKWHSKLILIGLLFLRNLQELQMVQGVQAFRCFHQVPEEIVKN